MTISGTSEQLYALIDRNDVEGVRAMLRESSGEVDEFSDNGEETALMRACKIGTPAIVDALLQAGADPAYDLSWSSNTCFKSACENPEHAVPVLECLLKRHPDIAHWALNGSGDEDYEMDEYDRDTPLTVALGRRDSRLVEWLLEHGVDCGRDPSQDADALNIAMWRRDVDSLRALMRHGAKLDRRVFGQSVFGLELDEDLIGLFGNPAPFRFGDGLCSIDYMSRVEVLLEHPLNNGLVSEGSCIASNYLFHWMYDEPMTDADAGKPTTLEIRLFRDCSDDSCSLYRFHGYTRENALPALKENQSGDLMVKLWWAENSGSEILIGGNSFEIVQTLDFEWTGN